MEPKQQSKILDQAGAMFIGAPADLGMPADFYHKPETRANLSLFQNLSWQTMCERLYVELFRQNLTVTVAKMLKKAWVAVAVIAVFTTIAGIFYDTHQLKSMQEAKVKAVQEQVQAQQKQQQQQYEKQMKSLMGN